MAMASSLPPGFEGALSAGSFPGPSLVPPQILVPKKATRESKKLSWASEDRLSQVRLFAAEDPPAQSSSTVQEMLLPKKARFMHMINPVVHADLPPGFAPSAQMGLKPVVATIVPDIVWRTPDRYKLDSAWLVMAGGESKEINVQRQRENRTLEAVYPRPSAIPESPAEPSEPQLVTDDSDARTLIIPVVPSDDDDSPDPDYAPTTSGSAYDILEEYSFPTQKSLSPPPGFNMTNMPATKSRNWFPETPQENPATNPLGPPTNILLPNGTPTTNARPGALRAPTSEAPAAAGPDVAAAAAAAYAAIAQSNDAAMIDRELLIKFLTNPSMLQNLSEKLAQNPPGVIEPTGNGARNRGWNPTTSTPTTESKGGHRYVESSTEPHSGGGYDRPPGFGSSYAPPLQSASPPPVSGSSRHRDDQYYKDLISQHGRKNEESLWGGPESESGFGGRPSSRANGSSDRDRKAERADRAERSERLESGGRWTDREGEESRSGQSRGKSRKACIYFTTSRGCRNGNSCAFVHESNNESRAKRPKLEGKEKGYRYSS